MSNQLPTQYQQFIHLSRYSRWLEDEGRRETWSETIERYFNFFEEHLQEMCDYKLDSKTKEELESAILEQKVMPSMRCLMTAGEALKRENIAGYNCSYVAVDRVAAFDEILYVLMNGTGVGFSVERQFTAKLPVVAEEFFHSDTMITVADSKLGWAKALKELVGMLYIGQIPRWDLSKIRPAGAPLKTFGGRASGPEPLERLFEFCVTTFQNASGRKLSSIECHDIVCKIAEIVEVGGVRRSALISLSNLSDDRMRHAKREHLQITLRVIQKNQTWEYSWTSGNHFTSLSLENVVSSIVHLQTRWQRKLDVDKSRVMSLEQTHVQKLYLEIESSVIYQSVW